MKRLVCAALITAFFALSSPADVSAQAWIFVGGGATIPTGDFSDFPGDTDGANTGWQGGVGAQFLIGELGLSVGPRVFYGSNNHDTPATRQTSTAVRLWLITASAIRRQRTRSCGVSSV